MRELLERAGVRVPALYSADLTRGFLLLEDLGDRLLLPALNAQSVEREYGDCLALLLRFAAVDVDAAALPAYDAALHAIFLGFVAVLPFFIALTTDVRALTVSTTGFLIVVAVVLDTMKQLEAQLLMRNYEGFIR